MFINEGDAGDEYTFCPPLEQVVVTNKSVDANIWIEQSETYSCLNIRFTMKVPEVSDRDKRAEKYVDLTVEERIYLYPKVPRIDLDINVDNRAKNHRLRIAFPTGLEVKYSYSDTHYYVIKRPTTPPKGEGWHESPPLDHQLLHWVDISDGRKGVMVATRDLHEYSVDANGTLYITLLRCVDSVGKSDLLTRSGEFNLSIPTPDAQCIGKFNFQLSIIPHKGDWKKENVFREALNFAIPLLACITDKHKGELPHKGGLLTIEPNDVIVTSVKKAEKDEAIVLRYYNASEDVIDSRIKLNLLKGRIKEAFKAKLSEENIQKVQIRDNEKLTLKCNPWEITTVKLYK